MSDNRPIYYSVAALAASASPETAIPPRRPRPAHQAQMPNPAKAAESEEIPEYWAYGERYFYTSARPDLRLDDDRDFKVERGEDLRQATQKLHKVKARDFAYEQHGVKVAKTCRCTPTAMKRQEWNRVLKHHNMKEMPIHFPQQFIGGASQSQNHGDTEPNSPARTEANSPVPTQPPSRRPTEGPSTFEDHPLSRQPNADDLAAALAAADLTPRAQQDPTTSSRHVETEIQATTGSPSPEPAKRTLPVARVNALRREAAVAIASDRSSPTTSTTVLPPAELQLAAAAVEKDVAAEPPTEPNSPAASTPASLQASSSTLAARAPRTPLNVSNSSLSRMVFGGDSPLTPFAGTPNVSFALTMKRKRSTASIGRIGSDSNLRRRLSHEAAKEEAARPKKHVRRTVEKAAPPTTRTTRSSSKAQAGTAATMSSAAPVGAAKTHPTASVRLRRAAAAATALATHSKTKKTPKKATSKVNGAKTRGKAQGRS